MNPTFAIWLFISQQQNERILQDFLLPEYTVTGCTRVEEVRTHEPGVIIIDTTMLEKHNKVLARLRKEQRSWALSVLLVTEKREINIAGSFLGTVIDEVIGMPVQKTELFARIEMLLRNQELTLLTSKLREDLLLHKHRQELLQIREERFRIIFENSLAVMLLIDPDSHRIVAANHAAEKFYGWKRGQLEKMLIDDINTLSQGKIKAEMAKARSSERIYFRFSHRLANGEIRDVEVYSGKVEIEGKDYMHSIIHDVSKQVEAERALQHNAKILRLFVQYSPASIAMFDTQMRYLVYSNRFLKDYDLGQRDLTGLSHYEVFPEISQHLKEIHQRSMKGEVISADNDPFLRANGTLDWIRWEVRPWYEDETRIGGIILFSEVITERKKAEEEIRQSEERFKALHNASFGGIAIHDQGVILAVNKGLSTLTGYSEEELTGMDVLNLISGKKQPFVKEKMKTGYEQPYEAVALNKNGKEFPVRIEARNVPYKGKIVRVAEFRDISEQKRAEEEIRKSEAKFRMVFESANVGKSITLPGGEINVNQAFADMLGYSREELKKKKWQEITPPEEIPQIEIILNPFFEGKMDSTRFEKRYIHKNGSHIWADVSIRLMRDSENKPLYFITTVIDISEQKRMTIELSESEKRFRTMVEGAPEPIFIQTEQRFAYLNQPALKLFGAKSEADLLGKPVIDRFHPDFHEQVKKRIQKLNEQRKPVLTPMEQKYIRLNGEEVWVETTGEPIFYQGKLGALVFVRDVSERKKAEEALSHSHYLMKYIIEHDQNAVAIHDKNLRYIYVSQRYLEDYRLKDQDIIGKHHYEIFPDIPEKWREAHRRALAGEVIRSEEDFFVRQDGTADWTRWECRPWYEADGSIGGMVLYSELINERKQKELEITQLNQRLEILIDAIHQLAAAQSLGKIQDVVAKSARKLIGADGATLVFREDNQCFYVNEDAIQPLWKGKRFPMNSCISGWVMRHKEPVVIEDVFKDDRIPKDIYEPTFVKSLAMVPVAIGQPFGAIGNYWKETYTPTDTELQLLQTLADAAARAIENINLYAELEERVKRRTNQLQAVNKELETFTYSVSHDLKAPLRGIDGYSKLLLDEYGDKLNDEASYFIQTIRSSTLQMNQLIDDLLSYSRLERSRVKKEKINLKPFIEDLMAGYADVFQKAGMVIKIRVPEKQVIADSTGLSIALRNYVENALKFTEGRSKPVVEIGFEEKSGSWILFVKDNGVGFDMKYHDRIFEIFQRLHRTEDFPGTGIGLAMVAKAVQRMEGKAWAESQPGKGAVFFMEIPKTNPI